VVLAATPVIAAPQDPPPVPVQVSEALFKELAPSVWIPGTVVSRNDARIAAEIPGQLTFVSEVGDRIQRGDVIAQIEDQALQLQLKNDDATIKRLQANLKYLDQQVERTRRLTDQQVVAANDLEELQSQYETARQELVQAQVGKEQTEYRLERTKVRAPFSGRVVERLQQPGGYIAVGGEIVRLVDTTSIEVRAQAPLSVAPHLREGMKILIKGQGRELESNLRTVVQVGDERSRMFEVRLAIQGEAWIIGSPVRVALPSNSSQQVVAVPRDALILRSDNIYLFKVSDEGKAERIAVETGVGHASLIEVIGDVAAGDRIVIRGGERLKSGQAVEVADNNTAAPAG
jgi:RND family efflux transporter MFP subunit